jgi:hypothetical protein
MDQEIQIMNGKFYTKPPAPVEIPRDTIVGWLTAAQQNLANAQDSKTSSIASQDATIALWDAKVSAIQALLAEIPE